MAQSDILVFAYFYELITKGLNAQLSSFWTRLTGEAGTHSLESRIFHAVCFVSVIGLALTSLFNYIIGITVLAVLMMFVFVLAGFFFYLSRVKRKTTLAIILFSLVCNALFSINFFYNSGVSGPSLLIFVLSFFLTMAVVPVRQYALWFVLNFLMVGGLLLLNFYYPELVNYTYTDASAKYIDMAYTYVIVVSFVFVITVSIRESYLAERALAEQRAAQLEESNATKNKLFSILAHDLRSPLSSIQNFLEVLSEYKLEEEERQTMQKGLLTETQNTLQMLSNLLAWSKEQMDGVTVKLREVKLEETLRTTLQLQATAASEKLIVLKQNLATDQCVMADPDMLQLVIRNLVNNAIKFTQPGGRIEVSAENNEGRCTIRVSDNGIGIPVDQQSKIFTPQGKSTYGTRNEKGVGLGLVLCKEFIELQHGTIGFQSTYGKGTVFSVILPSCSDTADAPLPVRQLQVK